MKLGIIVFYAIYLLLLFVGLIIDPFLKPILIPLLLVYLLLNKTDRFLKLIIGALLFSTFGDVFLLFKDDLFFILGLGSFFVAHILYIIVFVKGIKSEYRLTINPVLLLSISTYLFLFLWYLVPHLGEMLIPVISYAVIISVMLYLAVFWLIHSPTKPNLCIAIGALLFVVSDSVLAISLFKSAFSFDHFWVMLTYLSAQFLLIDGLIKRLRRT